MLVCWSGGCDSTVALYRALPKGGVRTITVDTADVHEGKREAERNARSVIKSALRRSWHEVEHNTIHIKREGPFEKCGTGLPQPIIWITTAQLYLQQEEDLVAGWIRGDDVWHYREWVLRMFEAMQAMTQNVGKLLFPLEWETKTDIIRALKEYDLYGYVWYCENPSENRPCGKCTPCRTHARALVEWEAEQPKPVVVDRKTKPRRPS